MKRMDLITFFAVLVLITGCAKPFEPWGYQFLPKDKNYTISFEVGAKDPFLGRISKDKLEMLTRYGKPTFISSKENYELTHSDRKAEEWIYLNSGKHLIFYSDIGELFSEEALDSLDVMSFKGYVEAGMSPAQLQRVKGEPAQIERTHLNYGAEEKWIYRLNDQQDDTYYFSRDLLFLWQKEDRDDMAAYFKI